MSKKMMLLALAAVSAALVVMPAAASAGTWSLTKAEKFTVANVGDTVLTLQGSALKVTCKKVTGGGTYTSTTGGNELTLTFHECKENVFSTACTTSGQTSGTIKTTDLTFDNVMLEKTKAGPPYENGTPGILITANVTHFATFSCLGITEVVTGEGIIGDITTPECGKSGTTATLDFESTSTGVQKWQQVTTAGEKFDLDVNDNGTVRTASMDATGTVTFGSSQTITCP